VDQERGSWYEELVQFVFVPEDVKEILSIPIRPKTEDYLAWHFDRKGVFSVKLAYRLGISLRDSKQCQNASSSVSTANANPLWKKLWGLELPGKVKKFI
jgi:hypothetical protein